LTLQIIDGIIPEINSTESIDGNEYACRTITANPGRCEPGDLHKQKILPERELKSHGPSKGAGLISRYPRYGLQQERELI